MTTAKLESRINFQGGYPDFSDPLVLAEPDDGECWIWTGMKNSKGYGRAMVSGEYAPNGRLRQFMAHRVVYEAHMGRRIAPEVVLDHLCRRHACVNPSHLEEVTSRENILRGDSLAADFASRTHCPQGHPYEGNNLYVYPDGRRACRACSRHKTNARRSRQKEAA